MTCYHKIQNFIFISSILFLTACGGGDSKLSSKVDNGDSTAPVFDGISGDTVASGATNIIVKWKAASDTETPAEEIDYKIYVSTLMGNPGTPVATVRNETSYTARYLAIDTPYFVSVAAVDGNGNSNNNGAEIEINTGTTVIYADDIQPMFDANCVRSGCHSSTNPAGNLILTPATTSYNSIVGRNMSSGCGGKYIAPGSVSTSLMLTRLDWAANDPCGAGDLMPRGGQAPPANFLAAMKRWIVDGAN